MNAPLGDETKMNQHLATNVILIGCEIYELEEAYKILMLTGVDLRFSGLTRARVATRNVGSHSPGTLAGCSAKACID